MGSHTWELSVLVGNPNWDLSWWGSCPYHRDLSWWELSKWVVLSGSCPGGKLSNGELSWWRVVVVGNCLGG